LERRVDVRQPGIRLRERIQPLGPLREPLVVRPADHRLHRLSDPAAAEAGRLSRRDANARHLPLGLRPNLVDDLARRALPLVPRPQDDERARRIDVAGAYVRAALSRNAQHDTLDIAPLHLPEHERLELGRMAVDIVEARTFG